MKKRLSKIKDYLIQTVDAPVWMIWVCALIFIGSSQCHNARSAMTTPPNTTEQQYFKFSNKLKNPGLELGTLGFGPPNTGTYSVLSAPANASDIFDGLKAGRFQASASNLPVLPMGDITLGTNAPTNLIAYCQLKVDTLTTPVRYELYNVTDSTVVAYQQLNANSQYSPYYLSVPGIGGKTYRHRLAGQSASDTFDIKFDNCGFGFGEYTQTATIEESVSMTGYTSKTSNFILFATVQQSDASTLISQTTVSGATRFTALQKIKASATCAMGQVSASHFIGIIHYNAAGSVIKRMYSSGTSAEHLAAADTNMEPGEYLLCETGATPVNTTDTNFSIVATSTLPVVAPQNLNWFVDVNIYSTGGAANVNLGTGNVAAYTEMTESTLEMIVNNSGNANPQIPCSTTNPSTGLTCSAGSEGLGIVLQPPQAGWVEVCMNFANQAQINNVANAYYTNQFRIIKTPNNAQTVLASSNATSISRWGGINSFGAFPHNICTPFYLDSTDKQTLRLMYLQTVSNPNNNLIFTARSPQDFNITVKPLLGFRTNIAKGNEASVPQSSGKVTPGLWVFGLIYAGAGGHSNNCTSNPCTVYDSDTDLATVSWQTTGIFRVNVPVGMCNNDLKCGFGGGVNAGVFEGQIPAFRDNSTTYYEFSTRGPTGVQTNSSGSLICSCLRK